jgi:hypothetical protein
MLRNPARHDATELVTRHHDARRRRCADDWNFGLTRSGEREQVWLPVLPVEPVPTLTDGDTVSRGIAYKRYVVTGRCRSGLGAIRASFGA